jgi:hypothetical protein
VDMKAWLNGMCVVDTCQACPYWVDQTEAVRADQQRRADEGWERARKDPATSAGLPDAPGKVTTVIPQGDCHRFPRSERTLATHWCWEHPRRERPSSGTETVLPPHLAEKVRETLDVHGANPDAIRKPPPTSIPSDGRIR